MPEREKPIPMELPPELAEFFRGEGYLSAVMESTNQGTAFVIKVPAHEIDGIRGDILVGLRHELYNHPSAPVVRGILMLYDQPDSPLLFEVFTNVAEDTQRQQLVELGTQSAFPVIVYDQELMHQLTKMVPTHRPQDILFIVAGALGLLADIPENEFNFDEAKLAVMRATQL